MRKFPNENGEQPQNAQWTGLKIAQKNCLSNDIFPQYGYKRISIYNLFLFMKFIVNILTNVQHNNQIIKGMPKWNQ